VLPAVAPFEIADGRQYELGAQATGEPGEHAGPPAWLKPADICPDLAELLAPELRMGLFHRRETAIDLAQMRILLGLGEGAIGRGAGDLALEIGPVTVGGVLVVHADPLLTPHRGGGHRSQSCVCCAQASMPYSRPRAGIPDLRKNGGSRGQVDRAEGQ